MLHRCVAQVSRGLKWQCRGSSQQVSSGHRTLSISLAILARHFDLRDSAIQRYRRRGEVSESGHHEISSESSYGGGKKRLISTADIQKSRVREMGKVWVESNEVDK